MHCLVPKLSIVSNEGLHGNLCVILGIKSGDKIEPKRCGIILICMFSHDMVSVLIVQELFPTTFISTLCECAMTKLCVTRRISD